jgi:hypothetical protein
MRASAFRTTLLSSSSCSAGSVASAAAWAAARRRLRIGEQPQFLHQGADPVEHRIDLHPQPVEGIAGARQRDAAAEVAGGDPVGDSGDVADAPGDIMGEDHAAQQPEQARDDQREQQRALERRSEGEAFADEPAADQPLAGRQPAELDFRLVRTGLAAQADHRAMVALLHRLERRRLGEIALELAAVGVDEGDRGLRIGISQRVVDRLDQRRLAAGTVDVGEDLRLLDHLAVKVRDGLVVGAAVDEADHREVREQSEQPREQRYA